MLWASHRSFANSSSTCSATESAAAPSINFRELDSIITFPLQAVFSGEPALVSVPTLFAVLPARDAHRFDTSAGKKHDQLALAAVPGATPVQQASSASCDGACVESQSVSLFFLAESTPKSVGTDTRADSPQNIAWRGR